MSLNAIFSQELPKITANTKPIKTCRPSGPQYAKTALVADLLFQLAFCRNVMDFISYPIIYDANGTRLAADIICQTWPTHDSYGDRLLLIVTDPKGEPADPLAIEAAQAWCLDHKFDFRMIGPPVIRSAYLQNAEALYPLKYNPPDEQGHLLNTLYDHLMRDDCDFKSSVGDTKEAMISKGICSEEADKTIAATVAAGWLLCNLEEPYGERSIISFGNGRENMDNRCDSLLRMILESASS